MSLDQRSTVQSPNRCAAWHRPGGATDIDRGSVQWLNQLWYGPAMRATPWWRRQTVVIVAGCLIAIVTFGTRTSFGLFTEPLSVLRGWDREAFALAIAVQNLLWGVGQPFAGAIADRYGAGRVPAARRSWAMGLATAAGSMGQFLFAPLGQAFISAYGAAAALVLLAGSVALVPILAGSLSGRGAAEPDAVEAGESTTAALRRALAHPSYVLLTSGFFVCGFHIAFISTHLPPYLTDLGISTSLAAWALGLIGLFNVIGAYSAGVLGGTYPKRLLLSGIYLGRGITFALFLLLPASPLTVLVFAASIGLLWLSRVPLPSGLVALMFGPRHVGMLFGLVFLSHQIGAFIGVWLGGVVYERTGTYDLMWVLCIALSAVAAAPAIC